MPALIDGHNLIPHIGLRLDAPDDELALIRLLQEYCRLRRARVEVYFDNAPPGGAAGKQFGQVSATFVRRPAIADEAIRLRLRALGPEARNWTVVSSDAHVQVEGRAAGARVLSSAEFARQIRSALQKGTSSSTQEDEMNEGDVEEWLNLFKKS